MVMEKLRLTVSLSESVADTVKVEVPAAVGVPVIAPDEADSESPAGSVPDART
jgi:hypothetical protein